MAVIIIAGRARSGKDTAADYLAEKHGYAKYTFSSVLKEALIKKGVEPTKENLLELGDSLREELGMDAVAKLLNEKIKEKGNIVLVGPRSIEEIDFFKKKFPKLKIIMVEAPKDKRFERRTHEDSSNEQKFFERDERDIKDKGLQKVLDAAKLKIINDSAQEKLYAKIEQALKKLG